MHIITDEHGNVVHGHHYEHDHHEHDHHEHDHHHDHSHHHERPKGEMEHMLALVGYMVDHNKHHAEELAEITGKLKKMGNDEAAGLLEKGVAEFNQGNQYLSEALAAISKG